MQRRLTAILLALGLALGLGQSVALAAPVSQPAAVRADHAVSGAETRHVAGGSRASDSIGVVVRFKHPSTAPLAAQLLSAVTSTTATPSDIRRGLYTFGTPNTDTDSLYALKLMLAASGIAYAEPNYLAHIEAYTPPTDPDVLDTGTWHVEDDTAPIEDYYLNGKHWWLDAIKAPGAWSLGQGATYPTHGTASDVKVAVIDVGIYLDHPEFANGTVTAGKDECASYNPWTGATTTDLDITPDATSDVEACSHGTAVAAAVGAEVNGTGMVGAGWNPHIVGYKVAGVLTAPAYDGEDWYSAGDIWMPMSAVDTAIYDAVDAGCKVINLSLGTPDSSLACQEAVTYAHQHGAVVVASVGNDGGAVPSYPAACTSAVGVGAIERFGGSPMANGTLTRWSDSNYYPGAVDVAAPGAVLWAALKPDSDAGYGSSYDFWWGTSFASPATAGAIAYLWRAMPDLTNDEIVSYVENTATDMGTSGRDDYYGYGLVNMQAAYNKLISDYPMLAVPTISAPDLVGTGSTVSWTASPGYNVGYQVFIDGVLRSTQTSRSYSLPSLSDGSHEISVLPTSARNWNTSSVVAKTLTVDSKPPALSAFSIHHTTITWAVTESSAYTVEAYVDAATPAAVTGNTLDVSGLSAGLHTLHVDAVDAFGNDSGWLTWDFACGSVSPVLSSVTTTDEVSSVVTWAPVGDAIAYDYKVEGAAAEASATTTSASFTISGMTGGVVAIHVRSVFDGSAVSDWATATLTDQVVVPATPDVAATALVRSPSVTVSWPPAAHAQWYEYRLNGDATTTTALSATVSGLAAGENTVSVRSRNNLSQSDWATATVTYEPPQTPVIGLSRSTASVAYPTASVVLYGWISAPNANVRLESSTNGVTWTDTHVSWTGGATPAWVGVRVGITRSMRYRFAFDGDAAWNPAKSLTAVVTYVPRASTPKVPSSVKRNRAFTVSVSLLAPAANRSSYVTFKFYRYQKSGRHYKWVLRKSAKVKGTVPSSTSMTYKASVKLPYTGKWRAVAAYNGASVYGNVTTSPRGLRVK